MIKLQSLEASAVKLGSIRGGAASPCQVGRGVAEVGLVGSDGQVGVRRPRDARRAVRALVLHLPDVVLRDIGALIKFETNN